jgi:hypothetical protein
VVQQRLRQADRLVRGHQDGQACVPLTQDHHGSVVIYLRQAQTAVLLWHFHTQGADLLQAVDHRVRYPLVLLDDQRVDVLLQVFTQAGEKSLALGDRVVGQRGLRVDEVEPYVAEEQALAEARQCPVLLTRGLGYSTCLLGAGVACHFANLLIGPWLRSVRPACQSAAGRSWWLIFDALLEHVAVARGRTSRAVRPLGPAVPPGRPDLLN